MYTVGKQQTDPVSKEVEGEAPQLSLSSDLHTDMHTHTDTHIDTHTYTFDLFFEDRFFHWPVDY